MLRSRLAIATASKTLHPASGRIDTRESGESLSLPGIDPEAKTETLDSREREIQGTLAERGTSLKEIRLHRSLIINLFAKIY